MLNEHNFSYTGLFPPFKSNPHSVPAVRNSTAFKICSKWAIMHLTRESASEYEMLYFCDTVKWKIHIHELQCVSYAEFEVRILLLTIRNITDHIHLALQFGNALYEGTGEAPFTWLSSSEAVFPPTISSHQLVEFVLSSCTADRSNTSLRLLSILTAAFTKPKLNHILSHLNPLYTITPPSLRSSWILC